MSNKKIRSICISPEVDEHITESKINLSKFIEEQYRLHYMSLESKHLERGRLRKQLSKLDGEIKLLEQWESKRKDKLNKPIDEEELNFFKKAIPILKKNPAFMQGQINLYNNQFLTNIKKTEFLEKLQKAADQLQNVKD